MKKTILITLLTLSIINLSAQEQTTPRPVPRKKKEVGGYSSQDGVALSMMGWGLCIAVGIAAVCALIPTESRLAGKPTTGQ